MYWRRFYSYVCVQRMDQTIQIVPPGSRAGWYLVFSLAEGRARMKRLGFARGCPSLCLLQADCWIIYKTRRHSTLRNVAGWFLMKQIVLWNSALKRLSLVSFKV